MSKYVYEVSLSRGKSNPDYFPFHNNVTALNAKAPDFGGINNVCLISHHMDAKTIQMLCSDGLKKPNDVTVEEITRTTIADENSHHKVYLDTIKNCFLKYDKYPNITKS